jgi:hypothetical protein
MSNILSLQVALSKVTISRSLRNLQANFSKIKNRVLFSSESPEVKSPAVKLVKNQVVYSQVQGLLQSEVNVQCKTN